MRIGTEGQKFRKELALSPELAAIGVKAHDVGIGSLTNVEFVRWSVWNQATARRMQNQFNDPLAVPVPQTTLEELNQISERFGTTYLTTN